eukprot:7745576-Alexandrium_andersonii.AAC.1
MVAWPMHCLWPQDNYEHRQCPGAVSGTCDIFDDVWALPGASMSSCGFPGTARKPQNMLESQECP